MHFGINDPPENEKAFSLKKEKALVIE